MTSPSQGLLSLYILDEDNAWACGGNNTILKTTNGGGFISGVNLNSTNIPDKFSLSQNYPNPFNPSTKINYEIKNSGFVSLKVFDLLGKEVAALVNEKQNAGSYAVDFNSSEYNLPSGIYFYTLNAGEFKETKKMVLIK
ncbi:MAG: T9SS type A sorting domain-containing protein [Bacteroidetes bacterium]|nr:T9SS type A sorting domain-containing protein [Bacteroidota bacterium]